MLDWTTCPAVESDPAKLGGAWVFTGTRVPVSVSRAQAQAVLEHAARSAQAA